MAKKKEDTITPQRAIEILNQKRKDNLIKAGNEINLILKKYNCDLRIEHKMVVVPRKIV